MGFNSGFKGLRREKKTVNHSCAYILYEIFRLQLTAVIRHYRSTCRTSTCKQYQVPKISISWTLLVGLVSHYHLYAEPHLSTVVWITYFDSPYPHTWLLKVWKSHTDLPGTISMFWNIDKHCAILLYYRRRQIIQSLLKFRIRKMAVYRQYMN